MHVLATFWVLTPKPVSHGVFRPWLKHRRRWDEDNYVNQHADDLQIICAYLKVKTGR